MLQAICTVELQRVSRTNSGGGHSILTNDAIRSTKCCNSVASSGSLKGQERSPGCTLRLVPIDRPSCCPFGIPFLQLVERSRLSGRLSATLCGNAGAPGVVMLCPGEGESRPSRWSPIGNEGCSSGSPFPDSNTKSTGGQIVSHCSVRPGCVDNPTSWWRPKPDLIAGKPSSRRSTLCRPKSCLWLSSHTRLSSSRTATALWEIPVTLKQCQNGGPRGEGGKQVSHICGVTDGMGH